MTAAADVEVSPPDEDPPLARTLRVNPEYRRSLLYVVVGGWAALALGFALAPKIDPGGALLAGILGGVLPPLFWIYASTLRLVVDDRGLSRRRLWMWTHWPWDDFSAGHVDWSEKNGLLTNRARPLWDRWLLALPFLEPDQVKFVVELIQRMCPTSSSEKCLKPPEPVEQLELNLLLFRKLRVTASGCTWLKTGELILWSEIDEFRIERQRSKGQCFYQLKMTAGSRSRRLDFQSDGSGGRGSCRAVDRSDQRSNLRSFSGPITSVRIHDSWRSPRDDAREAWLGQLRGLVPERCFVYFRTDGELTSVQEGEFRLKHLEDTRRAMRIFEWIGWAMLPIAAIFFGPRIPAWWNMPFLALGWKLAGLAVNLLMIVQPTVMLVPLSRHVRATLLKQQEETKRQMAALEESSVKNSTTPAVHLA